MQSLTKRHLSPEDLDALLLGSLGSGCRLEAELTDGWFNTAYRVRLDDGRRAVVKVAPLPDTSVLRYERGILATEAMVYRRIAGLPGGGVPTPELLHAGEEFIAVSVLDGTPWDKAGDGLPASTQRALRRELGAVAARLHTLAPEDGRFGYPAAESALSAPDWRTAFTAMVEALLDDAERWRSPLGVPPADIRTLLAEGTDALDEVTEPRLVHSDLWPGNIFVDAGDGDRRPRITGLIDHERAFWGDPAAELVSLAYGGPTGPDSDLVAGYTEAGGALDFTPALRHRLALYHLYLGLLLVVECGPRGYGPDHLAYCRRTLDDNLAGVRALG
ncbi:aminoglycoside phosphotransferase family protein [Streptomyces sp. WAC 05379]|uniref:phosphotransferase family protein n=1 Tax=Streptomyces TaxID=1883 RepID=UPI000F7353F5|nr:MULTISPECIES: aminoglycoside phosphotransferase family protein [unclassified Streptomyces]MBT1092612.1 phosphotransferase [Streptomyces sp. Tu102]RSN73653.1 aminoglycoside phosphotransferase family protein [Streptomyces sp. WAC 05379]